MTFEEILDQAIAMLRRRGRLTYRALKRQFDLNDDYLEDLKVELIQGQRLAIDEEGEVLVWTGGTDVPRLTTQPAPQPGVQPGTSDVHLTQIWPPPAAPQPADAERRQLTVVFCDLVDSTALSAQLDPEDLRDVVRAYQASCAEVIRGFDGHIAQYLGDGLLVYFGYPQAHEDDAQRAVHTALEILEAIQHLNTQLKLAGRVRLAVRLGIHTGLVVVGEMGSGGRQEQLALGETPNVAARLQGLAAPDTIAISEATFRLIQGYFVCHDLGSHSLKGLTAPVQVYRVLGESGVQSRLEVASARGLTPLVGRESEVALLLERWEHVKDGTGQVVLLSGEAGIGKSRLVQALQDQVAREPHTRMECRCSPYHQHSALSPIIAHLERVLAWDRGTVPQEKLRRLEEVMARHPWPLPEVVPLLAALLSLPLSAPYPPLTLTPERQKQKTLETLLAWLLAQTEQEPVLFIMEDLHWVDPSTLEWLSLVVEQSPTARLYALFTCRPEFTPPWIARAHLTPLTLSRLPRPQATRLVHSVTGGKSLPAEVLAQIVAKTDGVPLFVEELTKTVLESGLVREREGAYELAGPLPPLAIPTTLQDSLMARLDRLAPIKAVAQLGATIGRQFGYELLRAVSPLDEAALQQGLRQLVEAELLYQRGVPPQATYLFKHALIQDAAYQSLLKSTRQQYHQRIAQVLAEQFPETAETQPELLAHHYTEAGLNAQAVGYWQQAGQRAIQRSANREAVNHLTKGLALLGPLPDSPQRTQAELELLMILGAPLMVTKGYAAPEVGRVYARARELCEQIGETPQLMRVVLGLRNFYQVGGEFQTARELGEQGVALAQRMQDDAFLVYAHMALAHTLFSLGEFVRAREHLEQGSVFYNPQLHRSYAFSQGKDAGVNSHTLLAWSLSYLGYPEQALTHVQEALTLAQRVSHPPSLEYALSSAVLVYQLRSEVSEARAHVERALAVSREQGFAFREVLGTIFFGWTLVMQEQAAEGIPQMIQGIAAYRATGAEAWRHYWLALLAEAYRKAGQIAEGLTTLAEALALVDNNGECFYETELHRLKGELLLLQSPDNHPEVESCFHAALIVARHQHAKSLELRAATSLARLWDQQGKRDEARQVLAEVYGWFTEGFDTLDLKKAKALLAELSR
jgi:TOMM system kinase/cyclase fusion protein